MGDFQVFQIVQMVPNPTKHHTFIFNPNFTNWFMFTQTIYKCLTKYYKDHQDNILSFKTFSKAWQSDVKKVRSLFFLGGVLRTSKTSKKSFFAKIVLEFLPLTIFVKSSMLDVWLGSECTTIPTVKFSWDYEEYVKPLNAGVFSCRNQSIDLQSKSIDWFLYESNTGT